MSDGQMTLEGVALIADGDLERGKAIAEACATRGLVTRFASHGAEALEAALAEPPDVMVAALGLPLIDGPKLAGILRANPRTQGVRLLLVGGAPGSEFAVDDHVASTGDPETVLRCIETLLEEEVSTAGAACAAPDEHDLEGKLAQLGLADLLQLFHMNRKTGTVELLRRGLEGQEERGSVSVSDGNVVDARCGSVEGEKALHRLLAWRTGTFAFTRSRPSGPARIHTPTRALLLEGMRQLDEVARIQAELPALDAEIVLRVPARSLPSASQPLTREVLRLLRDFPRVSDILDRSSHPDYQVLRTIQTLVARELIELKVRKKEPPAPAAEPLFSGAQLGRLRDWAQRSQGVGAPLRDARLLVSSPDPAITRRFIELLDGLPEVSLDRAFREGRFSASTLGHMGRLGPEHEVGIELLHLPTHGSCEPLWTLAAGAALGVLYLVGSPWADAARGLQAVRRRLESEGRIRSFHGLVVGDEALAGARTLPPELAPLDEASAFWLPRDPDREGRQALAQLLSGLVP